MIKELLVRVINIQNNPFMSKDTIALQIEFFAVAGKITEEDRVELLNMLYPPEQPEQIVEEPIV